jgi:hypothetical protein
MHASIEGSQNYIHSKLILNPVEVTCARGDGISLYQ